ncbi:MAG: hypothetical protein EGQ35_05220 [Clostridiales bacterium]|nr:hypothetical protein [Clostridiales bacterium]
MFQQMMKQISFLFRFKVVVLMNNKLDTTEWKRFNLYDNFLFSIDAGNKFDKSKMSVANPEIDFVSRSNNNNGISCVVDKIDGVEPYKAGSMTIALGGEYLGSCFIQENDFYTSQNVDVLIPKWDMPDYVKRYISFVIFKESRMYYKAFEDELNRHMTTDFSILLPIDDAGTPDWTYMEEYMKSIEEKAQKRIDVLSSVKGNQSLIDTTNWRCFEIKDLFVTIEEKKQLQVPTGASINKKDLTDGDIPRITVTNFNNGISGYYSVNENNKDYRVFENFISVSFLKTVFYHPYKASLDMKVHCLQLKNEKLRDNHFINLFLVTALKASLSGDYADQISSKILPNLLINLPVTNLGVPDWAYMENYMKLIEAKTQERINILHRFEQ